jgi:hypothetical protein
VRAREGADLGLYVRLATLLRQWFACADLFFVSAPFEVVVISSRISNRSVTAFAT